MGVAFSDDGKAGFGIRPDPPANNREGGIHRAGLSQAEARQVSHQAGGRGPPRQIGDGRTAPMGSSPSPGCAHDQRSGLESGTGALFPGRGRNASPGGPLAVSPRVPGEAAGHQRDCPSPAPGRVLQTLQRLQAAGRQSHGSHPGNEGQRRDHRLPVDCAEPEPPGRAGAGSGCRGIQAVHPILEPGQLPIRDNHRGGGQRPRHHHRDRVGGDTGIGSGGIRGRADPGHRRSDSRRKSVRAGTGRSSRPEKDQGQSGDPTVFGPHLCCTNLSVSQPYPGLRQRPGRARVQPGSSG